MAGPELQIPLWLKSLPLAPEFRPTETEFCDPISFISRIEREASAFGICKIIPPLPRPSKKFVFSNLNSSLSASPSSSNQSVFTTRHQELGARKSGTQQQVWQSGELYTLDQFEAKSRAFSKNYLSQFKELNPLLVEGLFWKAAMDKPMYIEYANDVPGSGFAARNGEVKSREPGWRLSDSPWNLQVIARAPGSLTRYMPDDVPGVTSPMVYIGMLFSWFAWHVEDHELHSLNFLHFGSPKTWYAVPGDRARELEEIVRVQGYGGNVDRLASLAMLGEKTTLLSPEVIVASGLPCCRLLQNPGEFVVTFPRAYHVGFSHGFNCGEAANFATPLWLKFARDAAVRRAAMNYLPMLSHQQLLYLLAISFISRNPSELLSGGGRTSRLRDRKREDREFTVKRSFLRDMESENKLLLSLLSQKPTLNVVLWEPDLLPSTCSNKCKEDLNETRGEVRTDLGADGDLPFGLSTDSGSLTCVACGLLGFPFMAIVQPTESAMDEIFRKSNSECSLKKPESSSEVECTSRQNSHAEMEGGGGESNGEEAPGCCHASSAAAKSDTETERGSEEEIVMDKGWDMRGGLSRPRIFCLQHACETDDLLKNKGAARVLVICHSDYLKIKALAISISEEIETDFDCKDINLEKASPSDLYLINLSIDDDGHEEDGTDWTAKLGINLKYCVKLRKSDHSNPDSKLTLDLGGIFSDDPPKPRVDKNLMWVCKKRRTPYSFVCSVWYEGSNKCAIARGDLVNVPILSVESPCVDLITGERPVSVVSQHPSRPSIVTYYVRRKNKRREDEQQGDDSHNPNTIPNPNCPNEFARSPCEGLRPRKRGPTLSVPVESSERRNWSRAQKFLIRHNKLVKKFPWRENARYKCRVAGCGEIFRYISDFSRHRRITGHR